MVLETELEESLPYIHCVSADLQLILYNLLINASEAASDANRNSSNVTIAMRCRADQEVVELTVADCGPGFPVEFLPRVFEEQVSTKGEGRGLGLLLVAQLVDRCGGTAMAENRDEGGAIVTISFPVPSSSGVGEATGKVPTFSVE